MTDERLIEEARTGDFEDRGWMIDIIERLANALVAAKRAHTPTTPRFVAEDGVRTWVADTPTDDERGVDALCDDWPAPCNCDDPETHDGSVPRWLVQEERRIEPQGEPPKLARRLLAQGFSEGVNFIDDQPGPWGAAVVAGRAEASRRVAAAAEDGLRTWVSEPPTDDEREALGRILESWSGPWLDGQRPALYDLLVAAGFRRSEPQGEPSDADYRDHGRHWWACAVNAPRPEWRGPCDCDLSRDPSLTGHPATLRAAAEVGGEGR